MFTSSFASGFPLASQRTLLLQPLAPSRFHIPSTLVGISVSGVPSDSSRITTTNWVWPCRCLSLLSVPQVACQLLYIWLSFFLLNVVRMPEVLPNLVRLILYHRLPFVYTASLTTPILVITSYSPNQILYLRSHLGLICAVRWLHHQASALQVGCRGDVGIAKYENTGCWCSLSIEVLYGQSCFWPRSSVTPLLHVVPSLHN